MKSHNPALRVCIVEDDPPFREHLTALIGGSEGLVCGGAYPTAEAALQNISSDRPDVVLLDLQLPAKSGLDCLSEISVRWPALPILVLTICDDADRIFRALEAGASGYLLKPVAPTRLLEAIAEIHAGGAPMSSHIARLVLRRFREQGRIRERLEALTARESEILELLSQGFLSKEIGERLGISVRTIETHLHHIYHKLHVCSRAQAVAKFLRG
jgi:DNA-binding NarL/FixJ family response regulator